jgi:hypothetical protein
LQLIHQLQLLQYQNKQLVQKNAKLIKESQSKPSDTSVLEEGELPSPNTNIVLALQQQNKQLAIQLEVQCQ